MPEPQALTAALAGLDLGADVPEPLRRAVAEAVAWALRLEAESEEPVV